ncbi:MAG: glycosyltransferase [bacterium]|nr:glycosyltransferase [bacterium]
MAAVKPRVVHITTLHPVFDIRIFHKECVSLAAAGYDVTLIAPHDRDEVVHGVNIVAIPRYGNRLLRMTLGGWQALRKALRLNAAVYHFHDPELLPWMAQLKRRASVIYDVHENLPKAILTKSWIPAFLRPMVASLSRQAERNYALGMQLVLAETSYEADYDWATTTTVLNMPKVEELLQIDEKKHSRPTVGYLGAVNASRGSLTTLRALGRLKASGLEVAFECLGPISDSHRAELQQLASVLGISANCPGYTSAEDGWRAIARCHAGLALLHPQPNYIESYPTKVFEYMALGLPTIASNFPLYRELVEGSLCGICVDPLDDLAIAEAIRTAVGNPQQAASMGANGRDAVKQHYSWIMEAGKLLTLYTELLLN